MGVYAVIGDNGHVITVAQQQGKRRIVLLIILHMRNVKQGRTVMI